MKNILILILICLLGFSCGQSAEQHSEQARMDSLNISQQTPTSMDESSPVYAASESDKSSDISSGKNDDGMVNEKSKKEETDITTKSAVNNQNTFSLSKNLAQQSDTVYLQNVRLSKKFIKTADFRFKVKNVEQATHKIENLALKLNGYIQQSQTSSNSLSSRTIEISSDSLLLVSEYYINNNLIIRVPCIYFDSVLNEISKIHIYLDQRNVRTDDVSTIFLRNKLKAEKNAEYEKRIQKASGQGNRKLDDIVNAENTAAGLADRAIDKKIENYELQDRIDFSTITINLYQANSVHEEKVKNTQLREYQPNFWHRAWEGISTGWDRVLDILVALVYLWPLYLLIILIYLGIKYFRKRFMK